MTEPKSALWLTLQDITHAIDQAKGHTPDEWTVGAKTYEELFRLLRENLRAVGRLLHYGEVHFPGKMFILYTDDPTPDPIPSVIYLMGVRVRAR